MRPVCALIVVDVQNDFISGSLSIAMCPAQHVRNCFRVLLSSFHLQINHIKFTVISPIFLAAGRGRPGAHQLYAGYGAVRRRLLLPRLASSWSRLVLREYRAAQAAFFQQSRWNVMLKQWLEIIAILELVRHRSRRVRHGRLWRSAHHWAETLA